MVIILKPGASENQLKEVLKIIETYGLGNDVVRGKHQTIVGIIGDESFVDFDRFRMLEGVERVEPIQSRFKLIQRSYIPEDKVIDVKGIKIGGKNPPVYISGPCSIESKELMFKIAEGVKDAGAHILRGGAFKPRTSVHSFQGLGEKGLEFLSKAGEEFGMPTVSEVRGENQVELVSKYVDMLQIGARNMYNQDLIEAIAKQKKPIFFKRNFGAGIEEFLSFAERFIAVGNKDVILCERGIIPIGKGKQFTRYTLDISAVPVIKKESYLPIIVDPSHATGHRDLVFSMCKASIAAGAHGLMVEAHTNPKIALSDNAQMVLPSELKTIIDTCNKIYELNSQEKD